uniref:Putative secreted protein n=1 Tax=Ixodes ricinus TaxID=34613 RepID=A0A6B0UJP7_IXORI
MTSLFSGCCCCAGAAGWAACLGGTGSLGGFSSSLSFCISIKFPFTFSLPVMKALCGSSCPTAILNMSSSSMVMMQFAFPVLGLPLYTAPCSFFRSRVQTAAGLPLTKMLYS